jgi:NADH-quinone oxidoreductase subunit J
MFNLPLFFDASLLDQCIFHAFAGLITMVSLCVVLSQHPVKSAIFLVVDLFLLAGLYATLESHFVAAIQVLVYAGAIVVLFLFVIMLLNLKEDGIKGLRFSAPEAGTLIVTIIGFLIYTFATFRGMVAPVKDGGFSPEVLTENGGNTFVVAMRLFSQYIWPFELASILILMAIVAAIVIAKKDKISSSSHKELTP